MWSINRDSVRSIDLLLNVLGGISEQRWLITTAEVARIHLRSAYIHRSVREQGVVLRRHHLHELVLRQLAARWHVRHAH